VEVIPIPEFAALGKALKVRTMYPMKPAVGFDRKAIFTFFL